MKNPKPICRLGRLLHLKRDIFPVSPCLWSRTSFGGKRSFFEKLTTRGKVIDRPVDYSTIKRHFWPIIPFLETIYNWRMIVTRHSFITRLPCTSDVDELRFSCQFCFLGQWQSISEREGAIFSADFRQSVVICFSFPTRGTFPANIGGQKSTLCLVRTEKRGRHEWFSSSLVRCCFLCPSDEQNDGQVATRSQNVAKCPTYRQKTEAVVQIWADRVVVTCRDCYQKSPELEGKNLPKAGRA